MKKVSLLLAVFALIFLVQAFHVKTVNTDVVVIGAGASGSAAALALTEQGLKVVNIEKRHQTGGLGQFSKGVFAVGSQMQQDSNYQLTKDDAFKLIMDYSRWHPNAKLIRAYIDKSSDTIDWLTAHGVKFEKLTSSYPDGYYTWHIYEGGGRAVVDALQKKFADNGGVLMLETRAKEIMRDKSGRISGVLVEDPDGDDLIIKAKYVVMATGGYGSNREIPEEYFLTPNAGIIEFDGIFGDGIKMALGSGAAIAGHEFSSTVYRQAIPKEGAVSQFSAVARQPHLWLNTKGERFTNEANIEQWIFAGNALENQGGVMFVVFDDNTRKRMVEEGGDVSVDAIMPVATRLETFEEDFSKREMAGKAFRANDLKELAKLTGMDYDIMAANIERYNSFCNIRHDGDFVKDSRYMRPVVKAPFYAVKYVSSKLRTLGGVKINEKMQALNDNNEVVEGLYVVGKDAGGLHGDSYDLVMAGSTVGFAINSGRIAAESIKAEFYRR